MTSLDALTTAQAVTRSGLLFEHTVCSHTLPAVPRRVFVPTATAAARATASLETAMLTAPALECLQEKARPAHRLSLAALPLANQEIATSSSALCELLWWLLPHVPCTK